MNRVRPSRALPILFALLFLIGSSQGTARCEDEDCRENHPSGAEGDGCRTPPRLRRS